jgi:hypothetical protein
MSVPFDFKRLTTCRGVSQDDGDYVIRRFNARSAGLKKSVGLDPSLSAVTRDLHNQPKPRLNSSGFRAATKSQLMCSQQFDLNKT